MPNSNRKGKVGEREFARFLREHGFEARRGQQFKGTEDSPDVVSNLPVHFEVKRTEKLKLEDSCQQAREECGDKPWIVAHRKNRGRWIAVMDMEVLLQLLTDYYSLHLMGEE